MANQTFKLMNCEKEVGFISKYNNSGKIILSLKEFWGCLISKKPVSVNLDDFTGSVFPIDGEIEDLANACIRCEEGFTFFINSHKYAGCSVIYIYNEIGVCVYECHVDNTIDVTGKVMLPSKDNIFAK